ncbi:TMEM165/GDT1 family protein [Fusibacter tunisiensis]|uniref:GDT1 family protein n=1 Tax=Fusibacter tunisiensis TaxID=1008308 RepID=A0ABS2MTS6_9FIRM|nr:TMEM165/GDT1 family protein [Fusibacter tunisiensis]MBM7562807.1 putative Ca2+/H+ antiporter (TMEM165/GDT1 family) [Fusibacter tunisiensis]
MKELFQAFSLIFVAEMGDKTQIMAMAFATKYKVKSILLGVMVGSLLNHGLAIALGVLLNKVIPLDALQLVAGVLFVAFGLMSLSIAEESEDNKAIRTWGPVITVAMAFFLGELGDKTQLTALTLATQSVYPVLVLMGTVLGMVVVSSFGIFIGSRLGDRVPEHVIKIFAFVIFMVFGLVKIYASMYVQSMGNVFMWLLSVVIIALILFRVVIFRRQLREVSLSALKQKANALKAFRGLLKDEVHKLCKTCSVCAESECLIAYMEELLSGKFNPDKLESTYLDKFEVAEFDKDKARQIKSLLDVHFEQYPEDQNEKVLVGIYTVIERILTRESHSFFKVVNKS